MKPHRKSNGCAPNVMSGENTARFTDGTEIAGDELPMDCTTSIGLSNLATTVYASNVRLATLTEKHAGKKQRAPVEMPGATPMRLSQAKNNVHTKEVLYVMLPLRA